jgi:hypothetical protein
MVIFHSYVKLPEGICICIIGWPSRKVVGLLHLRCDGDRGQEQSVTSPGAQLHLCRCRWPALAVFKGVNLTEKRWFNLQKRWFNLISYHIYIILSTNCDDHWIGLGEIRSGPMVFTTKHKASSWIFPIMRHPGVFLHNLFRKILLEVLSVIMHRAAPVWLQLQPGEASQFSEEKAQMCRFCIEGATKIRSSHWVLQKPSRFLLYPRYDWIVTPATSQYLPRKVSTAQTK